MRIAARPAGPLRRPRAAFAAAAFLTVLLAFLPGATASARETPGASSPSSSGPVVRGTIPSFAPPPEYGITCPPVAPGTAEAVKAFVTVKDGLMTITARNGRTVLLQDFYSEDEVAKIVLYCLKDYFHEEGILLVEFSLYEGGGFTAVNLNTGERTHHDGLYVISPDNRRLLHDSTQYDTMDFIQVVRITPHGLVEEFKALPDNALCHAKFVWRDNETIEIMYSNDATEPREDNIMGVIRKTGDAWRMETNELYAKILSNTDMLPCMP